MPASGRTVSVKDVAVLERLDVDSGKGRPADEHKARSKELTGLRELRCDALGVDKGSVLVGMLGPGSVRREAVLVDDMKEIPHVAR
jgi:hypothetical protein